MGLLTEFLYPPPKKTKSELRKKEDAKQATQFEVEKEGEHESRAEKMTPTVHYHTLDGEVPNGGVPPDRLAIAIRQPPQPAPPQEDPPSGGMALVNPIIGLCNPDFWPGPSERTVNHYHLHYHGNAQQSNSDQPKSHLRFIGDGVRPSDCFPGPYKGPMKGSDMMVPLSSSIKELHQEIGSDHAGRGFQAVHKLSHDRWAPGPIFTWGVGDSSEKIGNMLLGKGKQDQEIFICVWQSNPAG